MLVQNNQKVDQPQMEPELDIVDRRGQQSLYSRIDELEKEKESILESTAWRITYPLRMVKAGLVYLSNLFERRSREITLNKEAGKAISGFETNRLFFAPWFGLSSKKPDSSVVIRMYIDTGTGYHEYEAFKIKLKGQDEVLVRIPRLYRSIKIEWSCEEESFAHSEVLVVRSRTKFFAFRKIVNLYIELERLNLLKAIAKYFENLGEINLPGIVIAECFKHGSYQRYCLNSSKLVNKQSKDKKQAADTLLSVLMPVFNTKPGYLDDAITSIVDQSYHNWELCVVDDASVRRSTLNTLSKWAKRDQRIKVKRLSENGGISKASNQALEMAQGKFVILMDHDDVLNVDALAEVAKIAQDRPEIKLIFSNEDRLSKKGLRIQPYFKPGWDRLLMLSQNLVSHLGAYERQKMLDIGGFRPGFEGSQDWDLALRFSEGISDSQIAHIPKILYHWRFEPLSYSSIGGSQVKSFQSGEMAVRESISRRNLPATVVWKGNCASLKFSNLNASHATVYLPEESDLLASSILDLLEGVSADYVCFASELSEGLSDELISELVSYFHDDEVVAVGGLLVDLKDRVVSGNYQSESGSNTRDIVVDYYQLLAKNPEGFVRYAQLLSPLFLVVSRTWIQEVMANTSDCLNIAVAKASQSAGKKQVIVPQVFYGVRHRPKFCYSLLPYGLI